MNQAQEIDIDVVVEGCKAGNRKHQAELYKHYYRLVFSICYRYLGNSKDAEDKVNDVFIKLFGKIEKYKATGSFEGWLKRLTVNACLDALRKSKTQRMVGEINESTDIYVSVEPEAATFEIHEWVGKLPERERLVLNMYCVEGYSHKEIAEISGISAGNSRLLLHNARGILKTLIEKAG